MLILKLLNQAHASKSCLQAPGRVPCTAAGLLELSLVTVDFLNRHGVGRHSRVAVVLPNGPELAASFFAISAAAAFAPLNPAYSQTEFRFYLPDLGASALITIPGFCPQAEAAAAELSIPLIALTMDQTAPAGVFLLSAPSAPVPVPQSSRGPASDEDIALLLHSSGTTARPKLIPLTHRNLSTSARQIAQTFRLGPEDRCLNVMPLFHIHGLIGALLSSVSAGAAVWCSPGFNALRFCRWLDEARPTWYTAVPTMHQAILLRAPERPPRHELRFIRSSSAHLHTSTWNDLEDYFGCPAVNTYGMTEGSHQIAANPLPPGVRRRGTVGTATGTYLTILDPQGNELPAGSSGEVAVQGSTITQGYLVPAEANATAFTRGWFRTGDQGVLSPDGYLTLNGRLKEIINCGGEKVSPAEIDEVLLDHPSVAAALTFPASCQRMGERILAAVVLHPGHSVGEVVLKNHLRERLARFKVPRQILFMDNIPKGPTGKMQRIGMAARLGLE